MTSRQAIQSGSSVWSFSSLLSKTVPNLFSIPDTLLLKDGLLETYIYTDNSGRVASKRNTAKAAVLNTFTKIATSSPLNSGNRAAVLRYADGSFAILDGVSFASFAEVWPPADPNITAVQSYTQSRGRYGTIFRVTYTVANGSGVIKWTIDSYLSLAEGSEEEGCVVIKENDIVKHKSTSSSTNAAFMKVIQAAVFAMEGANKCKVLTTTADILIDANDQVHLLWLSKTDYVTGPEARDLKSLGIPEAPDMRGSWLHGDATKPFPTLTNPNPNSPIKKAAATKKSKPRVRRISKTTATVSSDLMGAMSNRIESDSNTRRHEMSLAMDRTIFPTSSSNPRPTSPFSNPGVGAGAPVGLHMMGGEGTSENAMSAQITTEIPKRSQYPSNLKCHGQFCNMQVSESVAHTHLRLHSLRARSLKQPPFPLVYADF